MQSIVRRVPLLVVESESHASTLFTYILSSLWNIKCCTVVQIRYYSLSVCRLTRWYMYMSRRSAPASLAWYNLL